MRRCIALRHVGFEGLGALLAPLKMRGWSVETVDVARPEDIPAAAATVDLLIILGGPNAVYDHPPFIDAEIALSRRRIEAERATLGVCLGAQILAAALGATVRKGPVKELGWRPVRHLPEALADPVARHLTEPAVLQWHGDTFDLPAGAVRLTDSTDYENQAFRYGELTYALQYHLEVTSEDMPHWVEGNAEEIARTPTAQTPDMLLVGAQYYSTRIRAQADAFLGALMERIEARDRGAGRGPEMGRDRETTLGREAARANPGEGKPE